MHKKKLFPGWVILLQLFVNISNAQNPDDGVIGSGSAQSSQNNILAAPDDPNDAPLDGGLGLLLAAGAAYGVKQCREGKKEKNTGIF
jgi:hypothetical protein